MPYDKWESVSPAIRGIEPKVTLAQANLIASWADAMSESASPNKPENPYATSIAQFKRLYTAQDGKWVRKAQEKQNVQEAFKTIDGKKRPASDFLVVPDKDEPGSWALPVKVNGKVDHQLMGGAWAALHGGYRGNKYEGPDKAKALSKLKALYQREEMPLPTEEAMIKFAEDEQFTDAVVIEKDGKHYHVSFQDETLAPLGEWREIVRQWVFVEQDATPSGPEAMIAPVETIEMDFAESASGAAISLVEADASGAEPLAMDVCLIQPGWGNKNDNNYYPREMLKRYAEKFVGAHQYEKDHTDDKTTRDWVSTIDSIVGETPEGGPIARVIIHDPNFAARVRLLDKAELLKELPCSILARGIAKPFELDGKKGNQVEAITEVKAVDWVTAAGAGGHALALSEQEASMGEKTNVAEDVIEEVSTSGIEVVLSEDDAEPVAIEPEADDTGDETPDEDEEEPLASEEVSKALVGLPTAAQAKLGERVYRNATELAEAVKAERAYISTLTEAGKPFGQGSPAPSAKVDMAEVQRRQEAVNARYIGSRTRSEVEHD